MRTYGVPSTEGGRARAKVRTERRLLCLGAWRSLVGSGQMAGSQQEGMRAPSRALSHHRGSRAQLGTWDFVSWAVVKTFCFRSQPGLLPPTATACAGRPQTPLWFSE